MDPNSGMVTVHGMDDREAIPLNMHHFPIASTYCFLTRFPFGGCGSDIGGGNHRRFVRGGGGQHARGGVAISKSGVGVRSES